MAVPAARSSTVRREGSTQSAWCQHSVTGSVMVGITTSAGPVQCKTSQWPLTHSV